MKRTTPLRRSGYLSRSGKLPQKSKRRTREERIYLAKRREFLSGNPHCWVWIRLGSDQEFELMREIWGEGWHWAKPSEDVHHMAGRYGGNYLDEKTWMAVSRRAHDWIGAHPKEAEARGWIVRAKPASAVVDPVQRAADVAHDTQTEAHVLKPRRSNFHE